MKQDGAPRVVMFDAAYPPPIRGGKEKQAHLLSCALRDLGVSVRVLTLRFGADQPRELDGIEVTRCPANTARFAAIFTHLRRWRAASNVCHIHTPSWIGVYAGLVARSLGYKVIFKIPNENLTTLFGSKRRLWTAALRSFNRLVVLDEKTRQEYEDAQIDPERIALAANGVVVQGRHARRLESGKDAELLFLGRFVEQKGCRELLAAVKLLKKRTDGWRLTMMGGGPLGAELRETIDASGLADRIILRPRQDDVFEVLRKTDLLLVPSRREGMPNVVLEAMSLGVPVIATDVGAVRRLIGDAGESFIVPPGDVDRFADATLKLMQDPVRHDQYGTALYARAKSVFNMPVIAQNYLALYRQVLDAG